MNEKTVTRGVPIKKKQHKKTRNGNQSIGIKSIKLRKRTMVEKQSRSEARWKWEGNSGQEKSILLKRIRLSV